MHTNKREEKEVLCSVRGKGCLSYNGELIPFNQMLRLHPQLHNASLDPIKNGPICITCAENLRHDFSGTILMSAGGYRLDGDRLNMASWPKSTVMRPRPLAWPYLLDLAKVRWEVSLRASEAMTKQGRDRLVQANRIVRKRIGIVKSVAGNQMALGTAQGFLARAENKSLSDAERWVQISYAIDMVNCFLYRLRADGRLQRSYGIS